MGSKTMQLCITLVIQLAVNKEVEKISKQYLHLVFAIQMILFAK